MSDAAFQSVKEIVDAILPYDDDFPVRISSKQYREVLVRDLTQLLYLNNVFNFTVGEKEPEMKDGTFFAKGMIVDDSLGLDHQEKIISLMLDAIRGGLFKMARAGQFKGKSVAVYVRVNEEKEDKPV